ncbi:AraC family transcriptional regulator [Nonomuraea sp. NPDC050310]|uniref:AraC family transcriptional regulator n=1 Tax=unclassified Nonomuraea TaxID=2593643 RepID=UPI003400AAAA
MDPLADLLDGVRARSAAFCQAVLEPPWSLRIADEAALALATVLRGHAWVVPDKGEPVLMRVGDVTIVKGPAPYTISDDPATPPDVVVKPGNRLISMDGVDVTEQLRLGPRTSGYSPDGSAVVASGTYQVTGEVSARLLNALPEVVLVPRSSVQSPIMELLAQEVNGEGPGQQVVLNRLLDLALIATLRAWFARPEARAPGWYQAQSDPLIGPALRLIHGDPAHPWTVGLLADKVGASRAAFARRFATLVGEPPMAYLTGWRMALAADLLRSSSVTIDEVARQVGYANPFALSVAFKRVRGMSPSRHRSGG